jgi:hypothetical protein
VPGLTAERGHGSVSSDPRPHRATLILFKIETPVSHPPVAAKHVLDRGSRAGLARNGEEGASLQPQIIEAVNGIELNQLRLASRRFPMQLAAFDIEAGHFGRASRHDDPAIIFLG